MIWILFIVAIIILSIIVMMKGWNKLHCSMFYEGLIMAVVGVMSMGASMFYMDKENMEDMKNVYKFKKLSKMKLDDYGFGLFEYNGVLYFKEADEGRCFDIRSGNEAIIGKDKIITYDTRG